jgi:GAF domain-containing protein
MLARFAADAGPVLLPVGHGELLSQITETARRLFNAQACSLARSPMTEGEREFIIAAGAEAETVRELRIPTGQGIAGWVVMSGQAIAVDDVAADPRCHKVLRCPSWYTEVRGCSTSPPSEGLRMGGRSALRLTQAYTCAPMFAAALALITQLTCARLT